MDTTKELVRRLPLAELTDGMRVAEPVTDKDGRCLVSAGAMITERMLEQLAGHGVGTVTVTAQSVLSDAERQALRQATIERLKRRFNRVIEQPLMVELYRVIVAYRTKDLQ